MNTQKDNSKTKYEPLKFSFLCFAIALSSYGFGFFTYNTILLWLAFTITLPTLLITLIILPFYAFSINKTFSSSNNYQTPTPGHTKQWSTKWLSRSLYANGHFQLYCLTSILTSMTMLVMISYITGRISFVTIRMGQLNWYSIMVTCVLIIIPVIIFTATSMYFYEQIGKINILCNIFFYDKVKHYLMGSGHLVYMVDNSFGHFSCVVNHSIRNRHIKLFPSSMKEAFLIKRYLYFWNTTMSRKTGYDDHDETPFAPANSFRYGDPGLWLLDSIDLSAMRHRFNIGSKDFFQKIFRYYVILDSDSIHETNIKLREILYFNPNAQITVIIPSNDKDIDKEYINQNVVQKLNDKTDFSYIHSDTSSRTQIMKDIYENEQSIFQKSNHLLNPSIFSALQLSFSKQFYEQSNNIKTTISDSDAEIELMERLSPEYVNKCNRILDLARCGFSYYFFKNIKPLSIPPVNKLLRRCMTNGDPQEILYILFNIHDILMRTLMYCLLYSHEEKSLFINNLTQMLHNNSRRKPKQNLSPSDTLAFLYKQLQNNNGDNTNESAQQIFNLLSATIERDIKSSVYTFSVFTPDLEPKDSPYTFLDLAFLVVVLRNRMKSHGVLSHFSSQAIILEFLDITSFICECMYEHRISLALDESDQVAALIGHTRIPMDDFIFYHKELNDFFFLDGNADGQSIYIGFTSGEKFKPSTILKEA